jgi:hypothetical protein
MHRGRTFAADATIANVDLHQLVDLAGLDDQEVTLAKIQNIASNFFLGRKTAGAGAPEQLSVTDMRSLLGISTTSTVLSTQTQLAHGFTVGQVLRYTGTAWVLAQADTIAHARAVGVVQAVTTDTFDLVTSGVVALPGLTAGNVYFLDTVTAGGVVTTSPEIGILCYIAISTTQAFVFMAPDVVAVEPKRTAVADAAYTILPADRYVALTSITAPRIFTLPAANAVLPGTPITIIDESGSVTLTNSLTIQRAGSDTLNGLTNTTLSAGFQSITLFSDGSSKWITDWNRGFSNLVLLTSSSGNWAVPAGITRAKVTVIGGGGAGGAVNGNFQGAPGGSAGGRTIGVVTGLTPGNNIAYTSGAGGTGSNNAAGGNGGSSTFVAPGGTLTANGGTGGPVGTTNAAQIGTSGGTASGGTLNITGDSGGASPGGAPSGAGASTPYGAGGGPVNTTTVNGNAGTGFGSGGGGAANANTTHAGGNGAPGCIIIEY